MPFRRKPFLYSSFFKTDQLQLSSNRVYRQGANTYGISLIPLHKHIGST